MSTRMYQEALKKQEKERERLKEEAHRRPSSNHDLLVQMRRPSMNNNKPISPRLTSKSMSTSSPRHSPTVSRRRGGSSPERSRSTPAVRPLDSSPVSARRQRGRDSAATPKRTSTTDSKKGVITARKEQQRSHSAAPVRERNRDPVQHHKPLTPKNVQPSPARRHSESVRGISLDSITAQKKAQNKRQKKNSTAPKSTPMTVGPPASPIAKKRPSVTTSSSPASLEALFNHRRDSSSDEEFDDDNDSRYFSNHRSVYISQDDIDLRSPTTPISPGQLLGGMVTRSSRGSDQDYLTREFPPVPLHLSPHKSILKLNELNGPDMGAASPACSEEPSRSVSFNQVALKEYPRIVLEDDDGDVEMTIDWEGCKDEEDPRTLRLSSYEKEREEDRTIAKAYRSQGQDEIRQLAEEGKALLLQIRQGDFGYGVDDEEEDSLNFDDDPDYTELRAFLEDINPHLVGELPAIAKLGVVVPSDFKMLRISVDNLTSVGVKVLAARQIIAKSGGDNAVTATRVALNGPMTRKSQLKKLGLELGRRLTAFD